MSSDLVAFVRARLDEDERLARELSTFVGDGVWRESGGGLASGAYELLSAYRAEGSLSSWHLAHIARHDPARVRREVEAKRRIVAIHNRRADVYPDAAGGTFENCCQGCGFEGVCEDPVVEDVNDCPELKALAAVWSDHADFRAEWAEWAP